METQQNLLTDVEPQETLSTTPQRIFTNIIDYVLEIAVLAVIYIFMPDEMRLLMSKYKPYATYLLVFLVFTAYRMITIVLLQRTIGMILCRTKYLNENLAPLMFGEKMIATFAVRTKNIKIYKA
jgi:hypothetical protein